MKRKADDELRLAAQEELMQGNRDTMQRRMKKLFAEGFSVLDIAEPLPVIDSCRSAEEALALVEETKIPLVGVTDGGRSVGFLRLEDISGGECGSYTRPFDELPVLEGTASFPEAFEALAGSPWCFVGVDGEVNGIAGRMDIQKAPVRMWLFGMVTIIEMFLTRIIAEAYPGGSWTDMLSKSRVKKAEHLMKERLRGGGGVRLIDCLQLTDKGTIVIRDDELFGHFRFESKRSARRALVDLETLRNNLAHSHDLSLDWETILNISKDIDIIVSRI